MSLYQLIRDLLNGCCTIIGSLPLLNYAVYQQKGDVAPTSCIPNFRSRLAVDYNRHSPLHHVRAIDYYNYNELFCRRC